MAGTSVQAIVVCQQSGDDFVVQRNSLWSSLQSNALRLFHTGESGFAGAPVHPGDFTCEETHVPISNTTVKLTGPMIVPTSAKVGHCREHFLSRILGSGFFYAPFSDPFLSRERWQMSSARIRLTTQYFFGVIESPLKITDHSSSAAYLLS